MTNRPNSLYATAAGVKFHYHDLGEGAPTIFLHGGGPGCTAWSDFGPVAPLFAQDRRAILVDILQYGLSDKCTITGPMWDFHAAKVVALLDELGIDRADFVCNSWGGTIALNLAAKYPDRVRSLVITGSMPVFYGPLAPAARGRPSRPQRPRRVLRGRGPHAGEDASAHHQARMVSTANACPRRRSTCATSRASTPTRWPSRRHRTTRAEIGRISPRSSE
ncbi:alpha/beta fold hydrolase [Rhodococcus hoagii]|nr:alpha/beta fold hydrolase [Prescottella equi]